MVTCKDCLHFNACLDMLKTMELLVSGMNAMGFADDGIGKLAAICNAYERKDLWIPVVDRLPELKKLEDSDGDDWRESEFVLVATAAREVQEGLFWKVNNEYGWHSRDDIELVVTHWMPLPKPPKEGE